jgi:TP901 family phage tail tape measure protein
MNKTIGDLLVALGVDAAAFARGLDMAEGRIEKMGTRMFFLGGRLSAGVTAPLVAMSGAVLKFGTDFDRAMTESLAIMDNVTPRIRQQMEGVAQDVAKATKFSATQAAEGYYSLASAGLNAAESMGALPIAARFAQAGLMSMATSTDYLAGATAALSSEQDSVETKTKRMAQVADVLTQANNMALGTITDFSDALTNKAAAAMRQHNIRLEEGVAVLAAYAEQNIRGKTAGQQFWMTVRDLTTYALKNADAFKKHGIAVFTAAGEMRDMADIIHDVEKATENMTTAQRAQMFIELGIPLRSRASLQALLGYSDQIRKYTKGLEEAAGVTQRVSDNQMQAMQNQWKRLWHEAEILAIKLYQNVVPVINDYVIPTFQGLLKIGDRVVDWFSNLPTPVKAGTLAVMAFVAAIGPATLALGSMLLLGGSMLKALSPVIGLFGRMATAIGLATTASKVLVPLQGTALANALKAAGQQAYANAIAQGANAGAAMQAAKAARATVTAQNAAAASAAVGTRNLTMMGAAANALGIGLRLMLGPWGAVLATGYLLWPTIKKIADATGGMTSAANASREPVALMSVELGKLGQMTKDIGSTFGNTVNIIRYGAANIADYAISAVQNVIGGFRNWLKFFGGELKKEWEFTLRDSFGNPDLSNIKIPNPFDLRSFQISDKDVRGFKTLIPYFEFDAEGKRKFERDIDEFQTMWNNTLNWAQRVAESHQSAGDWARTAAEYTGKFADRMEVMANKTDIENGYLEAQKRHMADINRLSAANPLYNRDPLDMKKRFERDLNLFNLSDKSFADLLASQKERAGGGTFSPDLNVDPLKKQVQSLYDELFGRGKSDLAVMTALWKSHGQEIQSNAMVMHELGERYIKIRTETGNTIPLFEKLFAVQIEGFKKSEYQLNSYEDIFDKTTADFVENADKVEAAFDRLSSRGRATMFFEKHKTAIENLLPVIDEVPPQIQKILRAYLEWKATSSDATNAAKKDIADAYDKIRDISDKFVAELEDKQTDVLLFSKNYGDREIAGLRRGLGRTKLEHAKMLRDMQAEIMKLPEADQFAAYERFKIMQENSRKILDLTEREGLMRIAKSVGVSERILRNEKNLTKERLQELIRFRTEWQKLMDQIADTMEMTRAGADLASALGLDELAESMQGVNAGMSKMFKGIDTIANAENIMQTVTGITDAISGAIQAWRALSQTVGKGNRALSGAAMGAQIGTMIYPGIGTAVGAGIGALIGALKKDPRWAQVAQDLGTRFGKSFSEALGKKIEADAKNIFGGSFQAAQIANLDAIINEAGGLTNANFNNFINMFRDVFSMVETGQMNVAQATEVVDKNFETFAQHVVDSNRIASKSFIELIGLVQAFGIESKAVTDFLAGQVGRFGGAMSTILDVVGQPAIELGDKIKAVRDELAQMEKEGDKDSSRYAQKVKELNGLLAQQQGMAASSREEAERLGLIMLTTFNAALQNGVSWTQAMQNMGPSIANLQKMFEGLGITSDNAAVKQLLMYGELINKNKQLFDSVDALNQAYLAMSNIPGALTQESFDAMNQQFQAMEQRVQTAVEGMGGGLREALLPFVPTLQAIVDAADQYGFKIDENTQKLIDQAREMGIMAEKQLSTNDVLALGFAGIIDALGGEIPRGLQNMVDKLNETGDAAEGAAGRYRDAFNTATSDVVGTAGQGAEELWMRYGDAFDQVSLEWDQTAADMLVRAKLGADDGSEEWKTKYNEMMDALKTAWATHMKDMTDRAGRAADDAREHFEDWHFDPIRIPYKFEQEGDDPHLPGSETVTPHDTGAYVVTKPHLAMVHSNEAIVPISKLWSEMDRRFGEPGSAGMPSGPVTVVQELNVGVNARYVTSEEQWITQQVTAGVLEAIGGNDAPGYAGAINQIVERVLREKGLL